MRYWYTPKCIIIDVRYLKPFFGIIAYSNRVQFQLSSISKCLLIKGVSSVTY